MHLQFRKARTADQNKIWKVLQDGIAQRKKEGSTQWQNGYPNLEIIKKDILQGHGFVLTKKEQVIGYCAILINDEPDYKHINGAWLSNKDYVVFHRMAISQNEIGNGYATLLFKEIEAYARKLRIESIKADTNFDNYAMLYLFKKMGYQLCGEVMLKGSPRKAFEKVIHLY
ncbi:GNAT family N-acetyltransferase [Brumimicrobium salinarum]|uniref:GNAT family N-acetyltransferase n=1 Tax=Brumimicrobium salinarum TaxID=2058658 RepID=A0A2I0R3E7_9FLAO|nr:GNAT family N-acetyltransferase [Brumimicrobium salinarum]PKR81095.1 GNAT family N-acetyltransferase [Brumimicrobium salinarum]